VLALGSAALEQHPKRKASAVRYHNDNVHQSESGSTFDSGGTALYSEAHGRK
jgi:hypothetical protein